MDETEQALQCIRWQHHVRNVWCSNPLCIGKITRSEPLVRVLQTYLVPPWNLQQALLKVHWDLQAAAREVDRALYKCHS